MADCVITPYTAKDIATKDTNRVVGNIAKALATSSPFASILDGGVFEAGVSDTVRSAIQEQALPGDSLNVPTFVPDVSLCTPGSSEEGVATTEFTYSLGTKRGRGPKICVKAAFSAFKGSYTMAQDSLQKLMTQYYNSDVRATLYARSGVKYVAGNSGTVSFASSVSGTQGAIDTTFANIGSGNISQMTFKALTKLARHQHETNLSEMYEDGSISQHYKVIVGSEQAEVWRNEAGVQTTLIANTTGGFKFGQESLNSYLWEGFNTFRGVQIGIDQRPLRASGVDGSGQPILVEPYVGVATTKGTAARINPVWAAAPYEIGFMIGKHSFERLVPERFTGEGSFKFSPQLALGELTWHYQIDNDCNQYGDFGWHLYQITRAYKPIRPANVVPFLYLRCSFDTGNAQCASTGSLI